MEKLSREVLWSLEEYAVERESFRQRVIAHKQARRIALSAHATLLFEDFLTMKYQVQEMLRVARIFESAAIKEEIATYNPLIPDGSNWKATLLFEYPDPAMRAIALSQLRGIEHRVWVDVDDCPRHFAIANEDLDRTNANKTAAVHFLRFEFTADDIEAIRNDQSIRLGIDHEAMFCETVLDDSERRSLLEDFR